MSVHQRRDGRWRVRYKDKETDKPKSKDFGRGLEAERKAREFNESLGLRPWKKRTPQKQSPLFVELANAYTSAKVGTIQPVTLKNILCKMNGVIVPTLGEHTRAVKLTPARLDKYVKARLKAGVKRTTIHRELSDIRAVLNWSVKRGYLIANPAVGFEMPVRDDEIIMPPTVDEIQRLMAVSPPHLVRALALSYYTGLRPGSELYRITWGDLDCDGCTLLVISAKKHGRPSRRVPVHPEFFDILIRWYHMDIDAELPDSVPIVNYRREGIRSIKTAWGSAKEKAQITRRLRPYDLRHAFASSILSAGSDLKATSELLGHARPDTTVRIYQHTNPAMHRAAVKSLPKLKIKNPLATK